MKQVHQMDKEERYRFLWGLIGKVRDDIDRANGKIVVLSFYATPNDEVAFELVSNLPTESAHKLVKLAAETFKEGGNADR